MKNNNTNSPNDLKKNNWKSIVVNVTFQCYLYPGNYSRKLILSILAKKKCNKNRFAIFCLFCIFYIWQKVDDDLWVFGFNHSYHKALNTFIVWFENIFEKEKQKFLMHLQINTSLRFSRYKLNHRPSEALSTRLATHLPPKKIPPSNFA